MAQDVGKVIESCRQNGVPRKDSREPTEWREETGKPGGVAQAEAKVLSAWILAAHLQRMLTSR